jgi:hypothetical protein
MRPDGRKTGTATRPAYPGPPPSSIGLMKKLFLLLTVVGVIALVAWYVSEQDA